MSFYEDRRVGDRVVLGRHTFAAADIKSFATRFDPQAFHVDESAAERSHFGALCASGWHSAVMFMRLMLDAQRRADEAALARGERVIPLAPALGLRDLKWLRPVFAGDTLEYATEVLDLRVSKGLPRYGLMVARITGTNQHGELAISFVSTSLLERRSVE
jgi:acyl dehydratase